MTEGPNYYYYYPTSLPKFPYPYLVLQDPLSRFIQLSTRKEPGNHTERHYDWGSQLLLLLLLLLLLAYVRINPLHAGQMWPMFLQVTLF